MAGDHFALSLLGAALALACAPPVLDVPSREQSSWSVELEPPIADDVDAVAVNFRGRIRPAPSGAPWLFRDELSDYHERAVRRGEVPAALHERATPLRYWRDAAGDGWLQPLEWLEPDATYTLAVEGVGTLRTLKARIGAEPRASRLFPAAGRPKRRVAVVCDMSESAPLPALTLEPGGIALGLLPDMVGLPRSGCLTLLASADNAGPAVSPPLLGGALQDPAAWLPTGAVDARAAPCAGQSLGGACLEVLDDRLFITPEREDQLWLVDAPSSAVVAAGQGTRTALLRGLAAGQDFTLRAAVLTSAGSYERVTSSVRTGAPRRHLVLNEVLANPLGAEASGEWIELLNDSDQPASLGGLWLEDPGGHVALPDVELEAGELALLVGSGFEPSSQDVPIPEAARLVRLASVGTRGLANGGEALLLVGREGTLSRFPCLPANHAGKSWARRTPDGADDDAAAFAEHGSPGASPGAPNTFD
ncbi:MAG TPA: lamin tail domain-containing protein [Polyangiaceae bacterium]|nr:lamin tail domain-containing protein [Polyangiaceae bacterium]